MTPLGITTLERFEHIGDIGYTANSPANLATQGGLLVDTRWLHSLQLTLEGRAAMASSGGPTALSGDGIAALIERLTVEGFHRVRQRNEKIIDLRGAELDFLTKLYTSNSAPVLPSAWSFSGSANNDFRRRIIVPFVPWGVSPREQIGYLLDTPNYDSLKITVQWGDAVSCFGSGTAPTLTAYGSASGSPRVRVAGQFALAGPSQFANRLPGRVERYFYEVTGSLMTTSATGVRLLEIPRGNIMRSVILKTGAKQSVTAGNNAFATLSDTIIANLKVNRGINRPVGVFPYFTDIQFMNARQFHTYTAGYAMLDFARHGYLSESFDSRPMVMGSSGQTDFYLEADVTGSASQAMVAVFEEVKALPLATTLR